MTHETVQHRGAKFKVFIPCIGGCCPDRMQLKGYLGEEPYYQCERRAGGKRPNGEIYTENCYYHDNPYPARELRSRWIRDGKRWEPKKKKGDRPTRQDMETMI